MGRFYGVWAFETCLLYWVLSLYRDSLCEDILFHFTETLAVLKNTVRGTLYRGHCHKGVCYM